MQNMIAMKEGCYECSHSSYTSSRESSEPLLMQIEATVEVKVRVVGELVQVELGLDDPWLGLGQFMGTLDVEDIAINEDESFAIEAFQDECNGDKTSLLDEHPRFLNLSTSQQKLPVIYEDNGEDHQEGIPAPLTPTTQSTKSKMKKTMKDKLKMLWLTAKAKFLCCGGAQI